MKTSALVALAALGLSASAVSAANLTIGSGGGSLTVNVNDSGYVLGDTATYNTGTESGTTIWKLFFAFVEGSNVVYVDSDGTSPDIGAGSPSSTATTLTNNGRSAAPIPDLNVDLQVTLSQPTIGSNTNVAQLDFAWTLNNTSASPRTVSAAGWLDADLNIGSGSYTDNVIAFASGNVNGYAIGNPLGAIGFSNGPGSVDLNKGVLFDAITPGGVAQGDVTLAGIANAPGASSWWVSTAPYAATGFSAVLGIDSTHANAIEGDGNADYLIDAGTDIGGAISVDLPVPASGSATVTFRLIYGLDTTINGSTFVPPTPPSSVETWNLYN